MDWYIYIYISRSNFFKQRFQTLMFLALLLVLELRILYTSRGLWKHSTTQQVMEMDFLCATKQLLPTAKTYCPPIQLSHTYFFKQFSL